MVPKVGVCWLEWQNNWLRFKNFMIHLTYFQIIKSLKQCDMHIFTGTLMYGVLSDNLLVRIKFWQCLMSCQLLFSMFVFNRHSILLKLFRYLFRMILIGCLTHCKDWQHEWLGLIFFKDKIISKIVYHISLWDSTSLQSGKCNKVFKVELLNKTKANFGFYL